MADLSAALQSAQREAQQAFGSAELLLEKYLARPRHVEVQIFGNAFGNVIHLGERDCSVQRRQQKIIEESPAPGLTAVLREKLGKTAVALARAIQYQNAGTVEFLLDGEQFYFLEMNTRLQVEHPITELVTGVDLVKWQIRVAAGEPLALTQAEVSQRGHAIECRIYAEDPANGFLPDIGPVLRAVEPVGPGIRVDTGITSGDEVTLHYDPMLAKLIVLAENRADAIQKMESALRQYVILGLTTNIPFLRELITHPAFRRGETTTDFIARHFSTWQPPNLSPPDEAFIAAALAELLGGATTFKEAGTHETTEGDVYSPWQQLNQFRMGG
jgi:acetyl/propionyl-CoA carboxylase alpha subunit